MGSTIVNVSVFAPALVAKGDTASIRFVLGASAFADITAAVIYPNGDFETIDPSRFISYSGVVFGFNFYFSESGDYTFYVYDGTLSEMCVDNTHAAEWASKIDVPVSQLGRQRADIQRIYGRVNK